MSLTSTLGGGYSSVIRFANLSTFPPIGSLAVIYIANDTGMLYEWNGTNYQAAGGGGSPSVINVPSDFPTLAEVTSGEEFIIGTDVTDNDPTKTNTGQSFTAGQTIAWNPTGPAWIIVSNAASAPLPFTGSIFVDGTLGNNTTGTGYYNAPYATITKALSVAILGNRINIAEGTYTENLTFPCPIILSALGNVTIQGSHTGTYSLETDSINFVTNTGSALTFSGSSQILVQLFNSPVISNDVSGVPAIVNTNTNAASLLQMINCPLTMAVGSAFDGAITNPDETCLMQVSLDNCPIVLQDGVTGGSIVNYGSSKYTVRNSVIQGLIEIDNAVNMYVENSSIDSGTNPPVYANSNSANGLFFSRNNTWGSLANDDSASFIMTGGGLQTVSINDTIYGINLFNNDSYFNTQGSNFITNSQPPINLSSTIHLSTAYNCTFASPSNTGYIVSGNGLYSGSGNIYNGPSIALDPGLNNSAGATASPVAPIRLANIPSIGLTDGLFEYYSGHLWFTIGTTRYQIDQQLAGSTPLNNALFVAKDGNDSNNGSAIAPFLTITAAIAALGDNNSGGVIVAPGTYIEDLTIVKGVTIYGFGGIVTVQGNHTYNSGSGLFAFKNIILNSLSGAGSTILCQNGGGAVYSPILLEDCTVNCASTTAAAIEWQNSDSAAGSYLRIRNSSLNQASGSSGFGYLYIDAGAPVYLDNVITDLGDDHNNKGVVIAEYCALNILNGTQIDGQIYNPDGGITNIYAGVTLMKTTSSSPAMTIGTANTANIVNIYPGVICNSSATPAFTGNGIVFSSGGMSYPNNNDASLVFDSALSVNIDSNSNMQPASQVVTVGYGYNMINQDCLVIYNDPAPDGNQVINLPASNVQNRDFEVKNASSGYVKVEEFIDGQTGVSLQPNESISVKSVNNSFVRTNWNPTKLQNVLFVAKNGYDGAVGNVNSPFLTIGAAISAASGNPYTIVVMPGQYQEDIQIGNNVTLISYGSFTNNVAISSYSTINGKIYVDPNSVINAAVIGLTLTPDAFNCVELISNSGFNIQFFNCYLVASGSTSYAGYGLAWDVPSGTGIAEFQNCIIGTADSTNGKAINVTSESIAGSITLTDTDVISQDSDSNNAINLDGAVTLIHQRSKVIGSISTASTSTIQGYDMVVDVANGHDSITINSSSTANIFQNLTRLNGTAGDYIINGSGTVSGTNIIAGYQCTASAIGGGITFNPFVVYPAPSGGTNIAWAETPSGAVDGSNATFTIANSATSNGIVSRNGQILTPSEDYGLTGTTLTFFVAPTVGSILLITYPY